VLSQKNKMCDAALNLSDTDVPAVFLSFDSFTCSDFHEGLPQKTLNLGYRSFKVIHLVEIEI